MTKVGGGQSSLNSTVARAVFHGKRGELRQRYREGQEDQLGALGLVVNIIILWNTMLAYTLLGLVAVHVAAVVKHRYFDKADVLRRMV